jgi:hypothetical protein
MVKDEKRVNNDKYFETDEVFVKLARRLLTARRAVCVEQTWCGGSCNLT